MADVEAQQGGLIPSSGEYNDVIQHVYYRVVESMKNRNVVKTYIAEETSHYPTPELFLRYLSIALKRVKATHWRSRTDSAAVCPTSIDRGSSLCGGGPTLGCLDCHCPELATS
jgi:hypothetical protein